MNEYQYRFSESEVQVVGDISMQPLAIPYPYHVAAATVARTSASASFDLGLMEHSNFSGLLVMISEKVQIRIPQKVSRTKGCQV